MWFNQLIFSNSNKNGSRLCYCLSFRKICFVAGETDFLKPYGLELLESCVDPVVIHHPKGHTIPRFDEKGLETMLSFLERIQKMLPEKQEEDALEFESSAT
ncbi:hypothetical protein CRYUN_Cryun27aG0060800 [Craigia yunnanensis]